MSSDSSDAQNKFFHNKLEVLGHDQLYKPVDKTEFQKLLNSKPWKEK